MGGFHIWRMFNVGGSKKPFREDLKKFLFYALYAQGVPLLINIVTAIVDSRRDKISSFYPNMGELTCSLGEGRTQKEAYPSYLFSKVHLPRLLPLPRSTCQRCLLDLHRKG